MVNVRHKLCHHPGCGVVPTYGLPGTRAPVSCLAHSAESMVDVKREKERAARDRADEEAGGGGGRGRGRGRVGAKVSAAGGGGGEAERVQPEAPEVVEGRRRNILQAIVASSERVPELVAAAAAAAAAGGGGAQQGTSDCGGGSDESEWEEGSIEDEEEDEAGRNGHVLPMSFPLPPPPRLAYPPIAKTNSEAAKRLPFDESPLALLPRAVPRGSAALAVELQVMAAMTAAARAARGEGDANEESARGAVGTADTGAGASAWADAWTAAGAGAGVGVRAGVEDRQMGEQQAVAVPRMLPGVSSVGGGADPGDARDASGSPSSNAASGVAPEVRVPDASSGSIAGSGARDPAGGGAKGRYQGGSGMCDDNGGVGGGGGSAEGQGTAASASVAASLAPAAAITGGSSLRWSCVHCGRAVASGDRYVLACCGHGLLHRACTAVFTMPYYAGGGYPCPKCRCFVNSSLQVFL